MEAKDFDSLGFVEGTIEQDSISRSLESSFLVFEGSTDCDDVDSNCKRLAGGDTPFVSTILIGETIVSEITRRFFPFVALGLGVR